MSVSRTVIASILITITTLCMQLAPSTAKAASTSPSVSGIVLQVSDAQGNAIPNPGYFQLTAVAGSKTQLYAVVGNSSTHRHVFSLDSVDARSGVYGGISYNLPQQPRKSVGAWIHLSRVSAKIDAGYATLVPFVVTIPASTRPGQYIGGLTAFVPSRPSRHGSAARVSSITLQVRRVLAVEITVPGSAYARFVVSRINAKQRPDAVYLIAHIRNTGTTIVGGEGHLWMWKQGVRRAVLSVSITVDVTVPDTTVLFPIHWSKHPSPGVYDVKVNMTWAGGGRVTRQSKLTWPVVKR